MAKRSSHELPGVVRNGAWPTFLAAGGALLAAVLDVTDAPTVLVAPTLAFYAAFCALFNPTAGTDQDWFRVR